MDLWHLETLALPPDHLVLLHLVLPYYLLLLENLLVLLDLSDLVTLVLQYFLENLSGQLLLEHQCYLSHLENLLVLVDP